MDDMNPAKQIVILFSFLLFPFGISGLSQDLAAIYSRPDGTVSTLLFENEASEFILHDAFRARAVDLAAYHPHLTLAGDFTGDGIGDLALFGDLEYTPNLNPVFTRSVVSVSRSVGTTFRPSGTWYSALKTQLDFAYVSFAVAYDYNGDGKDDVAFFYNDPSSDELQIFMLESTGSDFSGARAWFTVNRDEFNFTALKFACPGDFNGNGKPDIAVFYNYFGTLAETRQAIFLFESEGESFTLLPVAYNATKAEYNFSHMSFALAGDYNLDNYTDIAVILEDSLDNQVAVPVFEGTATGLLVPSEYLTIPEAEMDASGLLHAASGNFSGDELGDLALFYNNQGSGSQEILLLEGAGGSFGPPEIAFSTGLDSLLLTDIGVVRSGAFVHRPLVSVAAWKDDRKGAISFTFDDGLRGAFEHGAAELESAGLKGTFYIFTDTTAIYDGELASTGLIRTYRELGHEIASHTVNHSDLGFLTEAGDIDSLEEVLSVSVELLNERFDQQTVSMSIPFGSFRHETLDHISKYFYSARSSQFGYNLATPYDFYALKSWPILSTTYPDYVDNLLATAESYGTYLPLMYHDMVDEPFDEETDIYNYRRALFRQTIADALSRDLWIATHERIFKYIRERNALKISQVYMTGEGSFSFIADDELADSLYNVELTLKIRLPESWLEDSVTIETGGSQFLLKANHHPEGSFVFFNHVPFEDRLITVFEGNVIGTGVQEEGVESAISISAFPNPFLQETRIALSGMNSLADYLVVRDIHGRIIRELREQGSSSYLFSREDLPPGIYIIQVIGSGRQLASCKVIAR